MVEVGNESSIWYGAIIRADMKEIIIGKNTSIQDNIVIYVSSVFDSSRARPVFVGNNVTVCQGAILHACTVEDESFIGMGCKVMHGAVVEKNAMIAAGAVVTPGTRVPTGQIWSGCPAKILRTLS